jgi:K+-sensing histidine kinase KdpD
VWAPYFQAEKSFTGQVSGMGLGLPLVAALVWNVGGTSRLYNRIDRAGVVVELTLPLER